MEILKRKRLKYDFRFTTPEVLMLERYIFVLDDPQVATIDQLLAALLQQQVDYIMDCLVDSNTVVDKVLSGIAVPASRN